MYSYILQDTEQQMQQNLDASYKSKNGTAKLQYKTESICDRNNIVCVFYIL